MKRLACLVLALGLAVAGCSSDDPVSPNSAPRISAGPSATPATILDTGTSILTVTASDANGDDLTYLWSCDNGTFTGDGELVVYHPEAVTGQAVHTVTVVVNDGKGGSVDETVDVTVNAAVVIGSTYRVQLNSLAFINTDCDGIFDNDVEAFWSIQALSASAVRTENNYVQVSSGTTQVITSSWAEIDVLHDGTGAITISGTVTDHDDTSANDLIGSWNLSYNTSNISAGAFSVSGGSPEGEDCRVTLNFTIEKLDDVYGAP